MSATPAAFKLAAEISRRFGLAWAGSERDLLRTHTDPQGRLTIGHCCHEGACAGETITAAAAEKRLSEALERVKQRLDAWLFPSAREELTPRMWAALLSFGHSVGPATLQQSTALAHVNKRNYMAVPELMAVHHFRVSDGKPMDLLKRRRRAEGMLFFSLPNWRSW